MPGILDAQVGYAGGDLPDPTYQSIKDYSEAIRVEYVRRPLLLPCPALPCPALLNRTTRYNPQEITTRAILDWCVEGCCCCC